MVAGFQLSISGRFWVSTEAVEAHRGWRGRNKKLIDDPPQLEEQWTQDLKRKAAERTEPKPQRFWPDISSHKDMKQKNR